MGANWQRFRIGNWQRDARQLPIAIETMSYGIGKAKPFRPLPQACKSVILNQLAIGKMPYKERTLCQLGSFLSFGGEKQGSTLGLSPGADGDALNID